MRHSFWSLPRCQWSVGSWLGPSPQRASGNSQLCLKCGLLSIGGSHEPRVQSNTSIFGLHWTVRNLMLVHRVSSGSNICRYWLNIPCLLMAGLLLVTKMTTPNKPQTVEEIAEKLIDELNDCIEWSDSGGDSGDSEQCLMGKAEAHLIKALLSFAQQAVEEYKRSSGK